MGAKLSEYWKLIRSSRSRRLNICCEMNSEYVNGKLVTNWNYNCARNMARHKFMPGNRHGYLKGNCSMLKLTVNDNLKTVSTTIIIYGRTDLICPKTGMVTHANWRRDLPLPFHAVPSNFKCYQHQGYVIVDLDLS